jgi:F0F1-type ATP synthase membrane subunit b/b'
LMSEKALRREVSSADHSRLLDESLAELKAASKA